jgi:hypothetical protein
MASLGVFVGTGTVYLATTNTTLIEVNSGGSISTSENQFFNLKNIRLDIEVTATSGTYGIHAGTNNSIFTNLDAVNIGNFYHGIYSNGARVYASRMFINNTKNDGVYILAGDMATFRDVSVIASGNHGFNLQVLYPRLTDCETYGNQGYGVYALEVAIVGGYYNNDRLGEIKIYHSTDYGRGGSIHGCVVEYAGLDPGGWFTTNTEAVGIEVDMHDNVGMLSISNVWVNNSQGEGILITAGKVNIVGSSISYSSVGGTYHRDLTVNGGFVDVSGSTIGPGAYESVFLNGGILTLGNSNINMAINDVAVDCLTGSLTLTGNRFNIDPNIEHTAPMIYVQGGVANVIGNQVTPKGSGSGYYIYVISDGYHRVVYNPAFGWSIATPSPTLGVYTPN